ncbi:MAG: GGDEF domain-containing protein [Campylobacterota bacterium]
MDRKCQQIEKLFTKIKQGCKKDALYREHVVELLETTYNNADLFNITAQDFRQMMLAYSDSKATDVAKETLQDFQESTGNISDITKLNIEQVENLIAGESLDLSSLKDKVSSFHDEVFIELEKANSKIEQLQTQIHSLEKEVHLDHLTKVYNRKTLLEDISKLIQYASKENAQGFSIIIIDLDDFKLINDKNGHLAGDKVLIYVAKLLKSLVRSGAKVYRFGGEEFIIVLNKTKLEEAVEIAKRVESAIAKNKLKYKTNIIQITASLGVTQYKKGDSYEALFQRADKAMYDAKANGKSRVEIG